MLCELTIFHGILAFPHNIIMDTNDIMERSQLCQILHTRNNNYETLWKLGCMRDWRAVEPKKARLVSQNDDERGSSPWLA